MKTIAALWLSAVILVMPATRVFSQVAGAVQPVLVTFDAQLGTGCRVFLTWTVQQQFVPAVFTVEKSTDGLYWASVTAVNSTGISSKPVAYNAIDKIPVHGINLYRLRIGLMDGSSIYTVVKHIRVDAPVAIKLYPNPSTSLVKVSLGQRAQTAYWRLALINQEGQVLVQRQYSSSETTISLPVGNYPNGHYTLQMSDGNSKQQTALMINHH